MTEPTFPAKLKLTWVEQVMRDREATFFDNTVAVAIASRVTDRSEATVSPSTIANIIGAKGPRSIVRSVMKLDFLGHLKVTSRLSRGRGKHSFTCQPIIKKRLGQAELNAPKCGLANPPLKIPISKIPSVRAGSDSFIRGHTDTAGAHANTQTVTALPHRPNALADHWQAMKDRVAEIYGPDLVKAWLSKLTLDHIDGSAVVFTAPTKFIARHVEANFAEKIIARWRHTGGDASVRDVRVLVGHPQPSFPNPPANDITPEIPELREASA